MNNAPLALVASLLLVALLAPAASAQVDFGTQVKQGDSDFIPLMKSDSYNARILDSDVMGMPKDKCIVLKVQKPLPVVGTMSNLDNKDIYLNNCESHASGTIAKGGSKAPHFTVIAFSYRYVDIDNSGGFNRGDLLYLTNNVGGAGITYGTVGGVGIWYLRMTNTVGGNAGTFAAAGDADIRAYSDVAKQANGQVVERDDKAWYLVVATGAPVADGAAKKNSPIPSNAIRVAVAPATVTQPGVIPTALALAAPDTPILTGHVFQLQVTAENRGTERGPGLLSTKIDGRLVDARLTPSLNPAEKSGVLVPVVAPSSPGSYSLQVNDAFLIISVEADPDAPATAAVADQARVEALELLVHDLQQQLAQLQAEPVQATAKAASVGEHNSLATPAFLGVLAILALAVALRRRE